MVDGAEDTGAAAWDRAQLAPARAPITTTHLMPTIAAILAKIAPLAFRRAPEQGGVSMTRLRPGVWFFLGVLTSLSCSSSDAGDAQPNGSGGSAGNGSGGTAGSGGSEASGGSSPQGNDAAAPDAPAETPDAPPSATGCQPLTTQATSVDGYSSDVYTYYDARCQPRSAALVRNDATDPGGSSGGFLRRFTYEVDGATRTAGGPASQAMWNGWGYVINHVSGGGTDSHDAKGKYRTAFAGSHHAIHEFTFDYSPGGPVSVTVHWFFATGRPNPVYAITFDISANAANALKADTRAPYGNLNFDGIANGSGTVAGDGWGDTHKFTTVGDGPVTLMSPWDYTQPNTVPYVVEWAHDADAEMGAVQTETFEQHPAGGDYGGGTLGDCWGHTSADKGSCQTDVNVMPVDWLWPFQLNQYELPFTTTSKRLAWGANYGAIGQQSYQTFGRTASGWPKVSYSVYVVLGKHSAAPVSAQVTEVETVQKTQLTASRGTVATEGPAGIARTDAAPYPIAGYDPMYGTWEVKATGDAATVRFTIGSGTLVNPILHLRDYHATTLPSLKLGGQALAPDVDYFASLDAAGQAVWITLNHALDGTADLEVN
jgi:hypothetical protein